MINKNYFKYLFKSKIIAWVFFGIMFIAISMSSFLTPGNEAADCFRVTTITSLVLSIIMSFALPVFLFSFVHRKRSCDMYFSLPIDRKELLITTITFSFVLIFSYYAITSIFALLFTMRSTTIFFSSLFASYAMMALGILALLIINSCIYLFANNIFDGIVMLAAYSAIFVAISLTAEIISDLLLIPFMLSSFEEGILFSPVAIVAVNFTSISQNIVQSIDDAMSFVPSVSYLQITVLVIYTCIACFLLKKNFAERKTERAEQVSNTFFSYPFIINFYLLVSLINLGFSIIKSNMIDSFILLYILLFCIYLISIFVYKRKIKFYWKNILYFVSAALITFGCGKFIFMNHAFSLPYQYPLNAGEKINYYINEHNLNKDLSSKDLEANYSVNLSINIDIPTNQLETEQYKQAVSILEAYRKQAIDLWFTTSQSYYDKGADLYISNAIQNKDVASCSYQTKDVFTIEELKQLAKIGTIQIEYYDYETDNYQTYTLDEYLKEAKL